MGLAKSIRGGGGGGFFLNSSKTPEDNDMNFCHFGYTPFRHNLHLTCIDNVQIILSVSMAAFCFKCITQTFLGWKNEET